MTEAVQLPDEPYAAAVAFLAVGDRARRYIEYSGRCQRCAYSPQRCGPCHAVLACALQALNLAAQAMKGDT